MATRELVWDGCVNVRDLGGLETEDGGSTRFGGVIRADTLGLLTPAGWQALAAADVSRIVDLREQFEIDNDPPREAQIEVVHVPVFDVFDEESWNEVEAASAGAPSPSVATTRVYLAFVSHCRRRFGEAVAAVAGAPSGAVVIHCHAGKDRTGLLAALLLRLADVPIGTIARDYALSAERLRERTDRWLAAAESDEERARIERIAATPAAAMQAVLETIDGEYGGVAGYLEGGGLAAGVIAAARARLR
ncbi:MAG TPA: tyrosine-protein phosphatase [Gaiellaceae bacterium]|nr:tyrosine-protein phosphatase [Gaiellaceae bacterium]